MITAKENRHIHKELLRKAFAKRDETFELVKVTPEFIAFDISVKFGIPCDDLRLIVEATSAFLPFQAALDDLELVAKNANAAGALFLCDDCYTDTRHIHEYYMVHDYIWAQAGMLPEPSVLCIGCLEIRLGRILEPKDFTIAQVNDPCILNSSARLRFRLGK
jgi:hypothetical protein